MRVVKKILFFLAISFFVACKEEVFPKPNNLIERKKMVDILYDLSLLESMNSFNPVKMDSFNTSAKDFIYRKYKVDSVQFTKSCAYYASDYDDYEKMYGEIKTRLQIQKTKLDAQIKAKQKKLAVKKVKTFPKIDSILSKKLGRGALFFRHRNRE